MRKILFFTLAVALPGLLLSQGSPNPKAGVVSPGQPAPTPTLTAAQSPKIVFKETAFDFGNVDEGPDITHEFWFRNRGRATLKITNVGTSCGCTAAVLDGCYEKPMDPSVKAEIPPGGRCSIKVTYHTQSRPGHATKIITISSNDVSNSSFQVKIDMTVVREVDVAPDKVYLYAVKHGEEHSSQIKILGRPGQPLEVLSVESTGKVVSVTSTPVTEGEGDQKRHGATLNVTLPATQPIGPITDDLVVKTTSSKKPQLDIQVMGEVVGRVQFNPRNVYFGPNQDQPVFVNITANPPQGFAVRNVSSVKHLCRPSIKTVKNPDGTVGYQLSIQAVKNIPKDSDGKDQVLVTTNDPETPEFKVDVQASH
jgi:hypothetical protein